MDESEIKARIKDIVDKYESAKSATGTRNYSEEDTINGFILPLFGVLGWDVSDKNEVITTLLIHCFTFAREKNQNIQNYLQYYKKFDQEKANIHKDLRPLFVNILTSTLPNIILTNHLSSDQKLRIKESVNGFGIFAENSAELDREGFIVLARLDDAELDPLLREHYGEQVYAVYKRIISDDNFKPLDYDQDALEQLLKILPQGSGDFEKTEKALAALSFTAGSHEVEVKVEAEKKNMDILENSEDPDKIIAAFNSLVKNTKDDQR